MGKTVTAADMLSAGRRRTAPRTQDPQEATRRSDDSESRRVLGETPEQLDDYAATPLDAQAPSRLNAVASRPLDDLTPELLDAQTPKHLVGQTPKRLDATAPEALDVVTSTRSDASTIRPLDAVTTRRSGDQTPSPTYQRSTVFFTPEQRQWIKRVARDLPDGLSMSDVVRLAVSRLQSDVANGLNLAPSLAEQAHADAEIFTGRRNRGLPSQTEQTA